MTEKLMGHVHRVDSFLIAGWALDTSNMESRPRIQIVQNGKVVITLTPQFSSPHLRDRLGLPASPAAPLHGYRLWLPMCNGIKPDMPFSVVFEQSGQVLTGGTNRRLTVFDDFDEGVRAELRTELLFLPSVTLEDGRLRCSVQVAHSTDVQSQRLLVGNSRIEQGREVEASRAFFGRRSCTYVFEVGPEDFPDGPDSFISIRPDLDMALPSDDARKSLHLKMRQLDIPGTVFDGSTAPVPLPPLDNIVRVSGPTSNQLQYQMGGLTTYHQIDAIARHYAGSSLATVGTVVDWGVGCGRVVRHLLWSRLRLTPTPAKIIGLDIDEVNVEWCRANLSGISDQVRFELQSLEGFDLADGSVDLLYGISVFTHLSEYHQHRWLAEIRRVLRPGGLAIVTVHGEAVLYRDPQALPTPFVQRFGFFDGIPDAAIGAERSDYYRASYHSRAYIKKHWGSYFEILDVIVMANAFAQDFVVVRRPRGNRPGPE